jgi:hypothetical protein
MAAPPRSSAPQGSIRGAARCNFRCSFGPHERLWKAVSGTASGAHTCSHIFRPNALLPYEHMFSLRTSPIAQRTLGALDLARSFLLLEDDVLVDWEVDRNGHSQPVHPHRAPLRTRLVPRRPGSPAPAPQECISPTFYGQPPAQGGNAGAERRERIPARRGWQTGCTETHPGCRRHARPAGSD